MLTQLLFSHLVMSDSFQSHGLQHARPPWPSPSPKVCLHSCSLHQWCHPAISSSDICYSFVPQSFPASGTFSMSLLFASNDWNTGASVSASVLPMNIQGWFPLRLTGLISMLSNRPSGVFSRTAVQGTDSLALCLLYGPALTTLDFPGGSDGKTSVYNAGDLGSIPGSGRSAGEGNGKLQYYCLESPVDRGVW